MGNSCCSCELPENQYVQNCVKGASLMCSCTKSCKKITCWSCPSPDFCIKQCTSCEKRCRQDCVCDTKLYENPCLIRDRANPELVEVLQEFEYLGATNDKQYGKLTGLQIFWFSYIYIYIKLYYIIFLQETVYYCDTN